MIGQSYLMDPMGLSVDYDLSRLVWVDKAATTLTPVLRTCGLDGSAYSQLHEFTETIGGHTVRNLTSVLLTFDDEYAAYFFDKVFRSDEIGMRMMVMVNMIMILIAGSSARPHAGELAASW